MLDVIQLPVLQDNYVYILHDGTTSTTAVVDPAVASPVKDYVKSQSWKIDFIFNTHHHPDHVGGNNELISEYDCEVYGPLADQARIPGITKTFQDGDQFSFGEYTVSVFDVPGHTKGHIAFHVEDCLFCGDTLFSLGCGRLFEGTPKQMVASLKKFDPLPDETKVYCAHEYTLTNAQFLFDTAKTRGAKWSNDFEPILSDIAERRRQDQRTVPSTLGFERRWNSFLRIARGEIPDWIDQSSEVEAFAELRSLKDRY